MTEKEKDLLLRDLCTRQMYNVKCKVFDDTNPYTLSGILHNKPYGQLYFEELDWKECDGFVGVECCKPYLFPFSSMTDEQEEELHDKLIKLELKALNDEISRIEVVKFEIDFYHKYHLDYIGLIPMGLANDATGLNIY